MRQRLWKVGKKKVEDRERRQESTKKEQPFILKLSIIFATLFQSKHFKCITFVWQFYDLKKHCFSFWLQLQALNFKRENRVGEKTELSRQQRCKEQREMTYYYARLLVILCFEGICKKTSRQKGKWKGNSSRDDDRIVFSQQREQQQAGNIPQIIVRLFLVNLVLFDECEKINELGKADLEQSVGQIAIILPSIFRLFIISGLSKIGCDVQRKIEDIPP